MTRSTVVLSLITLLALGGCNTASEVAPSSSTSESSAQVTDPSTTNQTTPTPEEPKTNVPPSTVSKPSPESLSAEDADADASEQKDTSSASTSSASTSSANLSSTDKPTTSVSESVDSEPSSSNGDPDPGQVAPLSAQSGLKDTAIVPGQKVGMVTAGTTYAQLESEFGSDRLTNSDIHVGEGFMAPATQVALDDGYSFNVVWSDESKAIPLEVRDLASGWTIQGIHNGMSFEALQAALGEFELMGLGWDYGGTLLLENTPLAAYSGKLFIRVQPSAKATETQSEKFQAVLGDSAFPSTDPNFADLDMSVVEMVVRLE